MSLIREPFVGDNFDASVFVMLEIHQLGRRFGRRTALDDISFDVAPGEIVGLLGANGAGKTTLLRVLAGYLEPSSGDVVFDGRSTFDLGLDIRRVTGYLPERCPLYDEMRVCDYLYFRARLRGLSVRRARRRVRETAKECGLEQVVRQRIETLSQGLRRRAGLADTLLAHPRILLLDDPLAGLDLAHGRQIRQSIVAASARAAVIISGHALAELAEVCTRFIVLRAGRLVLTRRVTDFPDGRAAEILGRVLTGEIAPDAACQRDGGAP